MRRRRLSSKTHWEVGEDTDQQVEGVQLAKDEVRVGGGNVMVISIEGTYRSSCCLLGKIVDRTARSCQCS